MEPTDEAEINTTLLIVDDEPAALRRYASALQAAQLTPIGAGSGAEAVTLLKDEMSRGRKVTAALIDFELRGAMDSASLLQALRELDQNIVFTVLADAPDRAIESLFKGWPAGDPSADAWDVLARPVTDAQVIQKARHMIAAWSRRRRAEAAVRAARFQGAGVVARGVGHEFGNILLRIMGKADLALMEKDGAKVPGHLEVIMASAERAGAIVRNLQSFSRSEPKLSFESITVPLERALALVGRELFKYSIRVERRFEAVPSVAMDVDGLSQVFVNLLTNARQAMPGGGTMTISVRQEGGPEAGGTLPGVVAVVADTGAGIVPEVLPRIFEFAFTTQGDRGTGLGLSVGREIVHAHGGSIRARSEPGRGTELTVWIPTAERGVT